MSTTGGSRKRRRISPDAASLEDEVRTMDFAHPPGHDRSAAGMQKGGMDPVTNGNGHGMQNEKEDDNTVCHHEMSLRALHSDLDSMRQLITCNICQRFMYEPYALSCGHTYCYSCLAEWMGKNHKKTCPDCRTNVKQEPTPAFLIKEMVLIFVNRTQLLPDGETSEEHQTLAREEAEILSKDRNDTDERQGGLFKGTFSRAAARSIIALHDTSDHVDRCPNCLHEVEDGWCLTCHVRVRASDSDSDDGTDSDGDSDMTEELDMDLEAHDMTGEHMGPWQVDGHPMYDVSSESDDSDEDDEDDHDLTGFIEDEVRWESDADEPDYSFEAVDFEDTPQMQRTAPAVASDVSDSDDDSDGMQPVRRRRLVNRRSAPSSTRATVTITSDSDEDDSEDEAPHVPSNSQRARGRIFESDDEASSDAAPSGSDSEDTTHHDASAGFSPPQYDSDDTTRPDREDLSPGLEEQWPIHVESSAGESDQDSDSNIGGESGLSVGGESRSDDDEDGESDNVDVGMGEPGSDEDSEGSEQSTATGWDMHRHLVPFYQRLTRCADIPIETNPRHRLATLIQRRPRFADPPLYDHGTPSFGALPARLPRVSRRSMPQPQLPIPSSDRMTQARAPAHPFNLESTLARITAVNRENQSRLASQRNFPSDQHRRPPALASLPAQRQALYEAALARDRSRRAEQLRRRSGLGRHAASAVSVGSSDSGSSRTARDEDHDTGNHLMGTMDDVSDGSAGW